MVVRTINIVVATLLLVALTCLPVQACFGPKLFVGVGQGVQEQALFALVTLYVQEKTGVESTPVDIDTGQDPLALLSGEKADLVFVLSENHDAAIFKIDGLPLVVAGKRPLEELQFTTVLPAIKKLNRLLTQADVDRLISRMEAGDSAMAAARKFLMELRWI